MTRSKAEISDWTPEWSAAELAEIKRGAALLKQRLSAMRQLREQLGLSQDELATALGISQSAVSKMEARSEPKLSILRKMIESKGGLLKIIAAFPDGETEIAI